MSTDKMSPQETLVYNRVSATGNNGLHMQDTTFDMSSYKKAANSLERRGIIQMRRDLHWVAAGEEK